MNTQNGNPTRAENIETARPLILSALESYGSEALADAERARALVGTDGIEEIAHALDVEGDVETAWLIRGALAALCADVVPEIGGAYESEAGAGFEHVEFGGFLGAWSE
jgi:hypothetical protein